MRNSKLWITLCAVMIGSFGILGYYGVEIYRQAPPIPAQVVTPSGEKLMTNQDIQTGQNVWQSMGGHEVGSIWGHGSYVAPDWSADWLHREAVALLEIWAKREYESSFASLNPEQQAALQARLKTEIRTNTFQPESGSLVISNDRAQAIREVSAHYTALFGQDPALQELRRAYAIPAGALKDPERARQLTAFFFWTAWSAGTNRPGQTITYTSNWPPEPLIDNRPSAAIMGWSIFSFILLLAGVAALVWYQAIRSKQEEPAATPPARDPFLSLKVTPSMKATYKYFATAAALLLVQVTLGGITAHYGVEGHGFYGIPLAEWLPYSVVRTWHIQTGIFWIATAWLATGLFVAPAISGHEPKLQRAGVNFLFVCLLIIVVGSMTGQWLGIHQRLGLEMNFWFGHMGYEYVDLGRFWQIFLFVGLFVWLFLMGRAMLPAFRNHSESRSLLGLFLLSSLAIGLFYGAGLMWGRSTHLAMAEYWRWWVVHLWVEGFFEVFATVVIAFLFSRLGLVRAASAGKAALLSTIIFLSGGILGTFHHLYFTGTPTAVLAIGATFSALEIVPLVLIGYEAYENLHFTRFTTWVKQYQWPIYFFVAVAFWNLVGAGLLGFMINPPIALYYMQGLNTTPVHGHTALFGVYGMLGIGLMLFTLKAAMPQRIWNTRALSFAFWGMNSGLVLMVTLSVLPIGLFQTWASVEVGMWYARSAEFMQQPFLQNLRWLRAIGDTVFAAGIVSLCWFLLGLLKGWSYAEAHATESISEELNLAGQTD